MTLLSAKLLELAAACENAEAPDRAIDAEIHARVVLRQAVPLLLLKDGWLDDDGNLVDAPRYTASLDAALTLIPPRWTRDVDATAPEAGIDVTLHPPGGPQAKVTGRSFAELRSPVVQEALATVAAALRAHAGDGS